MNSFFQYLLSYELAPYIMSYLKVWIHIVFSTKNREPYITANIRENLKSHIKENCRKKGIFLKSIGGYHDHLHCLVSLGKMQTIADVARLIKGESSFWINKEKLIPYKFEWQDDYFAVSVSHSHLDTVVNYIDNQESHHQSKTFKHEVDEFINNYGFQLLK